MLSLKADVNARDNKNRTPLHCASVKSQNDSHLGTIRRLLQNGANVNDRDNNGQSPLHHLVDKSNVKTVELLLNSGADVSIKTDWEQALLEIACCSCPASLKVIKLLAEYGLDLNGADQNGVTPIHWASMHPYDKDLFKFLFKNGGDINATDSRGNSPLMYAIRSDRIEKHIEFLLKYTDMFNIVDLNRDTLLNHERVLKLHESVIEHVAKLQELDIPIHPSTLKIISDTKKFSEYFQECTEELKVAKSKKLKHCWVTFFNLLVDSKKSSKTMLVIKIWWMLLKAVIV